MSLAMVVGCLIAGSTPLGGAVVAFPVAVLVLKLTPVQGRDFAVLIQSIGMTAAAYLIAVKKPHMVNTYIVQTSCVANTLGVIIGFNVELPGFWVNVVYMTYVVIFAGVLLYQHTMNVLSINAKNPLKAKDESDKYSVTTILCTVVLFASGIVGGILASKLGSGSDTMSYIFGIFIYNPLYAKNGLAVPESSLTVSSVVIMAYTTVVVTVIRLVQGDIARETYLCWGAVVWIVVFGAPVGSILLTPAREAFFRRLFYVLAVVQFATFAGLKIKSDPAAWVVIGTAIVLALVCVGVHAIMHRQTAPADVTDLEGAEVDKQKEASDAALLKVIGSFETKHEL